MRVVEQVPFGKRYASLITDVDIFRRIRDAYGVLPNLMQELKSHQELQQRPHLFTCRYTTTSWFMFGTRGADGLPTTFLLDTRTRRHYVCPFDFDDGFYSDTLICGEILDATFCASDCLITNRAPRWYLQNPLPERLAKAKAILEKLRPDPTTDCLSFTTREYHSLDGLANHRCQPLLGRDPVGIIITPLVFTRFPTSFYVVYRAAKRSTPSLEGSADLRSTLMIRTVEGLPDVYSAMTIEGKACGMVCIRSLRQSEMMRKLFRSEKALHMACVYDAGFGKWRPVMEG